MGMCVCLHAMFVYLFDARNLPWGSLNKQKKKYSVGRAVVMSYCDNWLSFPFSVYVCVFLHAFTLCKGPIR